MRLLATLATLAVARACDYNAFEHPNDFAYRYCAVACNKMELTDANYEPCCRMLSKGAETAAVCTQLASSAVAAGSTCSQTQVATTDSTSYSAPTSYSTAPNPTPHVTPTAKPTTSGIEGQSISSSQAVVTEWTTTTVPAPCETTASPSEAAPTDTCECPDEHPATTSSAPLETGGIQGQSYSSSAAAPSDTSSGDWAGNTPPEGYGGLDRRTEKQYTCACPAPTSISSTLPETSGIEGTPYSSASFPETTTETTTTSSECTTSSGSDWAGNTPTGEVYENERRFLPTIYGPGPQVTGPAVRRHTDVKRNEPPASDAPAESAAAQTITSTATVTGDPTCGGDDGGAAASTTDAGDWAGNTASAEVAENEAHRKRFRRWHM